MLAWREGRPNTAPVRRATADIGARIVGHRDGWLLSAGSQLSEDVTASVRAVLDEVPPALDDPRPETLDRCITLIKDAVGMVRVDGGGPIYAMSPSPDAGPPHAGVEIVTTESADAPRLRERRPMNWHEDEWAELVGGDLGPWAMAVRDSAVVAITHTPGPMTPEAAECGVWTHPAHRGQRLAVTTTAAWARLVGSSGRHLFYGTDAENVASQRVAERLGCRLIGRGWTVQIGEWPIGDAWGRALGDYQRGAWVPTPELETDDGHVGEAMHPEWFFRKHDEWDWWERELLQAVTTGPVLDLGAGAGRVSLWLQDRGIDVTAVDSSRGAVHTCERRGIRDARRADLNEPPDDREWKAFLLLCGNLGLGGSWPGSKALLRRLADIAAPDAILIGDTVEPRRPGEFGLRIRYKGVATPWWRQYNFAVAEIPALVDGTGWTVDRHIVDLPDHAVLLRRA